MGKSDQDFSGASAGHNIVAGDLTINNITSGASSREAIAFLVKKLEQEIENDLHTSGWIEDLVFFEKPLKVDSVEGLDAKLIAAGMEGKRLLALQQKELFSKFLEKRALYDAAQQLLALCLHRICADFDIYIHPICGNFETDDLNKAIHEKIIVPVVNEFACSPFPFNHGLVLGMTYWLADRCYIRWHKVDAA